MMERRWFYLGFPVALCVLVTVSKALGTLCIGPDAYYFWEQVDHFMNGDYALSMTTGGQYHPLAVAVMAIGTGLTGDFESGAMLAVSVFNVLTIFPLFWLSRDLFGPKVAFLSACLFALHPSFVEQGCDVQSNSIFIFFVVLWMFALVRMIRDCSLGYGALCGASIGLGYLVRPEACLMPIISVLVVLIRKEWKLAGPLAVSAGACAIFAFPLALFIHDVKHEWSPSLKSSVDVVEGSLEEASPRNAVGFRAVTYYLGKLSRAIWYPLVPVFAYGIYLGFKHRRGETITLILMPAVFYALLAFYFLKIDIVSNRYFLNFMVLLVPFMALGLAAIRWKIVTACFMLAMLAMIPEYKRDDSFQYKLAATDVQGRVDKIICTNSAVPLYAGASYSRYNEGNLPAGDCLLFDADWAQRTGMIDNEFRIGDSFRLEAVVDSVQIWKKK